MTGIPKAARVVLAKLRDRRGEFYTSVEVEALTGYSGTSTRRALVFLTRGGFVERRAASVPRLRAWGVPS